MPCGALVEPSDDCEIETEGLDEPDEPDEPPPPDEGGELAGGVEAGGDELDAGLEAVEAAALDDDDAGAEEVAAGARWTVRFLAAAWWTLTAARFATAL